MEDIRLRSLVIILSLVQDGEVTDSPSLDVVQLPFPVEKEHRILKLLSLTLLLSLALLLSPMVHTRDRPVVAIGPPHLHTSTPLWIYSSRWWRTCLSCISGPPPRFPQGDSGGYGGNLDSLDLGVNPSAGPIAKYNSEYLDGYNPSYQGGGWWILMLKAWLVCNVRFFKKKVNKCIVCIVVLGVFFSLLSCTCAV